MSLPRPQTVALRPIRPEDEAFLVRVYGSTRLEELALTQWNEEQREAFIKMQFAAQQLDYQTRCPAAQYDLILLDERPIGRLYVDRRERELRILDLTLLPEYRGAGLGTPLIQALLDEAATAGKTVTIYIEFFSAARRLFERLGFTPVEGDGYNALMEWRPTA